MTHHVLPQHLPGWGSPVVSVVCGHCGRREVGQVLRDKTGADWLATESRRWLTGILKRRPEGSPRRGNAFLVQALSTTTTAQARCKVHGWIEVDTADVRRQAGAAATGRAPRVTRAE